MPSLDEMLRVADVLVISAALTTATEGLIGARELGLMKENAILMDPVPSLQWPS
jgi:glyoxylate/hydroxypyruvate/2-ketogluconate reductase